MEDTLGRAPRRYLRTHGTHPLRPREVRSSRTTRCSRIARLREQPRSRPSREMLHQGPRTPTGKVQKRIVRASVVNLSENSRRPCPRACVRPCTPIARSLHAYRPRQTPARQQNAGRRRARTGLLRYIPRGTSPRRIAECAVLEDNPCTLLARKLRSTPQTSRTTSIQGVHACRRNRGEVPPSPPKRREKSEKGRVPPSAENECTPARFVCLKGSGGRRSAKTSKVSDGMNWIAQPQDPSV